MNLDWEEESPSGVILTILGLGTGVTVVTPEYGGQKPK